MNRWFAVGVSFLMSALVMAQHVEWSRLHIQPSVRAFLPHTAQVDSQGNLIIAGRVILTAGHYSVALVKYDPNGNLLWTSTFGASNQSEFPEALAIAPDDSIYLAVTRANTDSIAFVQRWSASGSLIWSQEINLSAYDVIQQLLALPDGGVEVLHNYGNSGIGYARLIYDANGNLLAQHRFDQPNTLLANATAIGMIRLDSNRTMLFIHEADEQGILRRFTHTRVQILNTVGQTVAQNWLPLRTTRFVSAGDGTFYLLGDYWNPAVNEMRLRMARIDSNADLIALWDLDFANGDSIPDVLATDGGVWLASGSVETESERGTATMLGLPNSAPLNAQALVGAYRPMSAVNLGGMFALLIGELEQDPFRWKPRLQWWRTNGNLVVGSALPPLTSADEQPEILLRAPDGALYVVATVNAGNDNTAGAGIWRIHSLPGLNGRIILQDFVGNPATRSAQFQLVQGSQSDSVSVNLDANGNYSLVSAFTGAVEVRVGVPGWLTRRQTLNLNGTLTVDWTLLNGDANRDNLIDDADLLMVLFNFGTDDPQADLNADGVVDDADLLIVLFNFGLTGE